METDALFDFVLMAAYYVGIVAAVLIGVGLVYFGLRLCAVRCATRKVLRVSTELDQLLESFKPTHNDLVFHRLSRFYGRAQAHLQTAGHHRTQAWASLNEKRYCKALCSADAVEMHLHDAIQALTDARIAADFGQK